MREILSIFQTVGIIFIVLTVVALLNYDQACNRDYKYFQARWQAEPESRKELEAKEDECKGKHARDNIEHIRWAAYYCLAGLVLGAAIYGVYRLIHAYAS